MIDWLGLVVLILAAGIGSIVVGRAIDRRMPQGDVIHLGPNAVPLTQEDARACEAAVIAYRAVLLQGYYRAEQDAD